MSAPQIKVFALDDIEYWAGESLADCIVAGKAECGLDAYDEPDDQHEVSEEAMHRLKFQDDDGTVRTFAEELALRVAAGETFPQPFAASDW